MRLARRRLLAGLASGALVGCGSKPGPAREIEVAGGAGYTDHDVRVITTRLDDVTPRRWWDGAPAYRFQRGVSALHISASATPPESDLRYLLEHRGAFEVRSEFGPSWFDQRHIADALAAVDEAGRGTLRLRLTDAGRERLAQLSRSRAPAVVQVMFDRRSLTFANVPSPILEGRLELSMGDRPLAELVLIAQVLRSGALSFEPGQVRIAEPGQSGHPSSSGHR